jgi:hypothetical protein
MSIQDRSYADPTFGASHELGLGRLTPTVSGAADEVIARHRFFTAAKLHEVRATVMVAGKGTSSKFNVYKGTSSIGAVALSTSTAGSVVDASLTATDFDATDDLVIKNAVATETASAFVTLQYQERFA